MVIGLCWWLFTGDYSFALPLALFFELFWLDLFPIGSYMPPMAAFPYLVILSLAGRFGWQDPITVSFPLAMSMPLAYIIPYFERWQRDIQKSAFSKLLSRARKFKPLKSFPGCLIGASALQQIIGGLLIFLAVHFAVSFAFSLESIRENAGLIPLDVDWSVLYGIAAIGALSSLRIKRAYFVFAMCMVALLALKILPFSILK